MREHARAWNVAVDDTLETETSLIGFGRRDGGDVVLKVVKHEGEGEGDEWHCGEVLSAFGARGVVGVHEYVPGACLMERLRPGHSLVEICKTGRDDEAIETVIHVVRSMEPTAAPATCPTVHDWGRGFDWYRSSGDSQIPEPLVDRAAVVYRELARTQRTTRLLHGDLQHSNVLLDADRGWLAVDPKGVVGEMAYEVGAVLRNPRELPELVGNATVIERRIHRLASALKLDAARVVGWGFAQAVLSLIWSVEDGSVLRANDPSRLLADASLVLLREAGF